MLKGTNARKLRRRWWNHWRRLVLFGVALSTIVLVIFMQLPQVDAQDGLRAFAKHESRLLTPDSSMAIAELSLSSLPAPQTHPLPNPLTQWQDTAGSGDYFSEIKLTPMGYLVWFQFPVKVYVERLTDQVESPSEVKRFQDWIHTVLQAVKEWEVYLPLEIVDQPTTADILILRSRPPLQASINHETGKLNIPRARSAQTRYEFYLRKAVDTSKSVLSQRFTIQLSPDQSVDHTLATARHELGHALGIWGHSPSETDVMYFSQVRHPPQISARDINTLKRIYQQPTRLGWSVIAKSNGEE